MRVRICGKRVGNLMGCMGGLGVAAAVGGRMRRHANRCGTTILVILTSELQQPGIGSGKLWTGCGKPVGKLRESRSLQASRMLNGTKDAVERSMPLSRARSQTAVVIRIRPQPTGRSLTPSARFPPGRPPASRPRKRWCPRSWCTPHRRGGGICPAGPAQGRGGPASPVLSAS